MKRSVSALLVTTAILLCGMKPEALAAPDIPKRTTFKEYTELNYASSPQQPKYQHGDCSWLEAMALSAGWEPKHIDRLTHIVQRESGCCPNRAGGDRVNKQCRIIGVSEWNHRSDTGLLQINGVHWKPDHPQYHGLICKRMRICTQQPLFDAKTNLIAGKLLFDVAGWSPWGF